MMVGTILYIFLQILTPQKFLGSITKLLKQRKDLNYGKSTIVRNNGYWQVNVKIPQEQQIISTLRKKLFLMLVILPLMNKVN